MIWSDLSLTKNVGATYACRQLEVHSSRVEDSVCCHRHRLFSESEVRNFFFLLSLFHVAINSIIQQPLTIYNISSFSYSIVIESSTDIPL